MEMHVTFPGKLVVTAQAGDFTVATDQGVSAGGDGSAPSPFLLFLSSIATCAGFFAMQFCNARGIDTTGMALSARFDRDPETRKLKKAVLELKLPAGFPEKYRKAIVRAMDECSVKRTILDPPEFEVTAG